ncbi:FkbM family methyltransferase [Sphingobacterium oryzagri]|uniref:FkbM family methyltransferase n=1 Tax=Sphingobacterium oryzagri TaxID=3025669 RepID=A0ABY7WK93_9SPHI|nr:FkbM family methyltransferase [Sphingobacterium sp. KACC 22765]WDF67784.1 FkbM family methyltransferase [Sphingobacterium sp. KACC 22765]
MERNSKLKRLEYWIKARLGKIAFITIEYKASKQWYGSDYGGFYVHPDALTKDAIVYSFGIGQDISFDRQIIARHDCQVFGFDPTPKSINWVASQDIPDNFNFYPYGLGVKTEEVKFHLPKNKDHVSGSIFDHRLVCDDDYVSVPLKSFSDILKETGHKYIDVLKMDIEGSEYVVIDSILAAGIPIKQLLLETHERFFEDGTEKGKQFFKTLHAYGYRIFAISDTYQEISLIKV